MNSLLVRGTIITCDKNNNVIEDGAVLIEGKKIIDVGRYEDLRSYSADEVIGSKRCIVMPGLINTHTHLSMTLFKGLLEGLSGMEWLKLAWSIESELTGDDIYWGAMLGCIEMLRSGTTCFADHYFQMDNVAKAVESTGLRAALAEAILDFGDRSRGEELVKKGKSFAERWNKECNGRINCMMGPHSTYTCTPYTLELASEAAREIGVGIHLHLLEHREEASLVKKRYGKRPLQLLDSINFLGKDVLAAHVTFANDDDLLVLKKKDVNVNVNVYCKMKGGQGIARIREMLDMGINVSLGTDGPASHNNLDMFEEMKLSIAAVSLKYRNPKSLSASESIRMATVNGAKALGIEDKVGSIEKGKEADIIVLNGHSARATPFINPEVIAAQTLCGMDVQHVIVQGKILLRDGKIVCVDEENIIEKAEEKFVQLMNRVNKRNT